MKPPRRPIRFAWLVAVVAALALAVAVLALSSGAKKDIGPKSTTAAAFSGPRPLTDASVTAADADPGRVRRPAAAAVAQWLQVSNDKLTGPAEDYQLDAPRKRNELGELEPFREQVMTTAQIDKLRQAATGETIGLDFFPDVRREVTVTGRWDDPAETRLLASVRDAEERDRFSMSWMAAQTRGLLEMPSLNRAYEILRRADGTYVAREWLYTDVICARPTNGGKQADSGMPPVPVGGSGATNGSQSSAVAVPALNSRPSAVATIYLDFDGEVVSGTAWAGGRTINALPARMTAAQIEETWRRVSNHFAVFDVNVTTERARFDAAPGNRKTHCVITPTTDAAPMAGGVAYLNSFTNPSNLYKVCWTFADQSPEDAALVSSHEIGHTLNLNHHGRVASGSQVREEYYFGHGSGETGWGPFMGAPYGKNLLQWSKGEYTRANNSSQDDLVIMSTAARIPFLNDDHGNDRNSATLILSGTSATGLVERTNDSDFFKVEMDTGAQPVSITLAQGTMLDAEIKIYDSAGRLLQTLNPPDALAASGTVTLSIWDDVFIEVRGTGKPPVSGDGYSNYSSLGSFTLTAGSGAGTGPAIALVPSRLPGFRANEGSPSAAAAVQVRARRLTGPLNVTVAAPYEVSLDNNVFSRTVQPAPDAMVHVRLAATAGPGVLRRSLSAASAGAVTRTMSLAGLVFGGAPEGAMRFVEEAMDRLHYFTVADPGAIGFQRDYVLQFADYHDFLEGQVAAGMPDREARAETILRMTGFSPGTGTFDHAAGYALTGSGFANFARLGLPPSDDAVRNFVRTARFGATDPVPMTIPSGGFNGLSGAPWGATMGMAGAMRDFFNSRAFRDRYPEVRLMTSSSFYNWMRDVMFPGRAMGAQGPEALLDMMENAFTADYPLLSARRAMARGAAASFRSVYATVLTTEARGGNDGSHLEEPFLRRLHMAALRHQLWGEWNFAADSPELSKARLLELLRPPVLNVPANVEVDVGVGAVFQASSADRLAPINRELVFEVTTAAGSAVPAGINVEPATGRVSVASGALPPGTHRVAVSAYNFAGRSAPRMVDLVVPVAAAAPAAGRGADWMATYQLDGCVESGTSADHDGFCLVTEYLFGMDPTKPDGATHSLQVRGEFLDIEWKALKSGATYVVQQSTNLREWSPAAGVSAVEDLGGSGPFHRRLRASVQRSGSMNFYRVAAQFESDSSP